MWLLQINIKQLLRIYSDIIYYIISMRVNFIFFTFIESNMFRNYQKFQFKKKFPRYFSHFTVKQDSTVNNRQ